MPGAALKRRNGNLKRSASRRLQLAPAAVAFVAAAAVPWEAGMGCRLAAHREDVSRTEVR